MYLLKDAPIYHAIEPFSILDRYSGLVPVIHISLQYIQVTTLIQFQVLQFQYIICIRTIPNYTIHVHHSRFQKSE